MSDEEVVRRRQLFLREVREAEAEHGAGQAQEFETMEELLAVLREPKTREFKSLGRGRGGGRPYQKWTSQQLYDKAFGSD